MKSITLFWDWILYNDQTLRNLRNEKPAVQKMFIYWLDKHLHNYCEQLESILMFPASVNESIQLVISASGNPEYFDQVTILIENAPKLRNWKFVAFIQPSQSIDEMEAGLDKPYVFKDIELKASELKFMPCQYEDVKKIDIIVYLKKFTVHCTNKNLLHLVFIILQDLVGEKSFVEHINFVEIGLSIEKTNHSTMYLYELQHYLDSLNERNRA
ncbi:hypothetical protein FNO01nite_33140 [Flavobacterium noncentrifugens]|uniref:Uncharacterized protein n=1 Tax=Flavobacterium noncentrifugens TaxID=1128970 RepID=A0A1G8ZL81_9FLAO|nr:hypothetical protein [Flavobacterium noncentrifugens]GEP52642.1 hypothetical protein FNO01nite_33140 [Flavobacterium noncentrifugens]SDK15374.1 hypothetical protein SAMN04487935_2632 [Flavobacterium noncentrifugens]